MQQREYTLLSLGDSYTIGEGVDEADRFPQSNSNDASLERNLFREPKIIATTGWTTDELMSTIQQEKINDTFDFVT
jgi:hypothetical protein